MNKMQSDFLIIGAGIMGLAIARELHATFPNRKIIIIEKEIDVALHASGRNSGVLHAGFYYSEDSLKAKFTCQGNKELTEYCIQNNLSINQNQKVVVTRDESELEILLELKKRGEQNGVSLMLLDEKELASFEPNAHTIQQALLSPHTSTINPKEICQVLKNELISKKVLFYFQCAYKSKLGSNSIRAGKYIIESECIINCTGLYADKIAHDFNAGLDYTILPFKGVYVLYSGNSAPCKTNIYPVPNLANPFLGVHFTVTVDNHVKIGPTAMPAFWREQYGGCKNFNFNEFFSIGYSISNLFLQNSFGFRTLAFSEMKKYNKKHFINMSSSLVKTLDKKGFLQWSAPGIRAQLLQKNTNRLMTDFIIEKKNGHVHVLNAVSPAFTSSFPFARYLVEKYIK